MYGVLGRPITLGNTETKALQVSVKPACNQPREQ